jgi:hypothetical protein
VNRAALEKDLDYYAVARAAGLVDVTLLRERLATSPCDPRVRDAALTRAT